MNLALSHLTQMVRKVYGIAEFKAFIEVEDFEAEAPVISRDDLFKVIHSFQKSKAELD